MPTDVSLANEMKSGTRGSEHLSSQLLENKFSDCASHMVLLIQN